VRDDLEGLEITQKELQSLTNLPVNDELIIIINPLKKWINKFIENLKGPEGATAFFIGFGGLFVIYILLDFWIQLFATSIKLSSWLLLILLSGVVGALLQIFFFIRWKKRTRILKTKITHSLKIILADVDRYNTVIKAIDINDQIESAGNPEVSINERNKVIEALKLTRADLVRALMTERILRENKKFIINNTELFANNLTALITMQMTEQATEHGRFLNEALQIALDVQHEMRRLQNS
jgi:hypothetical protein